MKLHILIDWCKTGNFFLEEELTKMGNVCYTYDIADYTIKDRVKKGRILILYLKYIQLAYKAVKNSNENEILLCWNFTSSIAVGYISKILNKKRVIIGLNLIAHPRNYFFTRLRKLIYKPIMNMPSFYITVNSEVYVSEYSQRFQVNSKKFYVLSDPIKPLIGTSSFTPHSFVFTGGEAQRDWSTFFKACELVPEIPFVGIARKKYFDNKLKVPRNVKLYFDTDDKTFYNYMGNASLVLIPLKSQLPCGLIILLKAAMMHKPVISTSTPSTRNYIQNGFNGFLVEENNWQDLASKTKILFYDSQLQKTLSTNLHNHVLEYHSCEIYTKKLINIIENVRS